MINYQTILYKLLQHYLFIVLICYAHYRMTNLSDIYIVESEIKFVRSKFAVFVSIA